MAQEHTVDQLAAAAGMTVRNVRAYAARGLLPPPRLVGRTGFYGPEHLARLRLVRTMLAEGHSLTVIERTLSHAPATSSVATLALHRALVTPFLDAQEPEEIAPAELAARAGVPEDPAQPVIAQLVDLGVVERVEGTSRLRVLDPALLEAGLQVVRLGIPPEQLVAAQREVARLVAQAAEVYVRLFRDTAMHPFLEAGAPEEDLPAVQRLVEQAQPVAAQALLASFRRAMAEAIERTLAAELTALERDRDELS